MNSGNNRRPGSSVLKAHHVAVAPEAFVLGQSRKSGDTGKLTLNKENGVVKGFEYQCACGRKDHFVCE
jgi:hypothetical protein